MPPTKEKLFIRVESIVINDTNCSLRKFPESARGSATSHKTLVSTGTLQRSVLCVVGAKPRRRTKRAALATV
jgi:hypothetical protein